jgi:hypothetical protein
MSIMAVTVVVFVTVADSVAVFVIVADRVSVVVGVIVTVREVRSSATQYATRRQSKVQDSVSKEAPRNLQRLFPHPR